MQRSEGLIRIRSGQSRRARYVALDMAGEHRTCNLAAASYPLSIAVEGLLLMN